jgi:hypothetical protein
MRKEFSILPIIWLIFASEDLAAVVVLIGEIPWASDCPVTQCRTDTLPLFSHALGRTGMKQIGQGKVESRFATLRQYKRMNFVCTYKTRVRLVIVLSRPVFWVDHNYLEPSISPVFPNPVAVYHLKIWEFPRRSFLCNLLEAFRSNKLCCADRLRSST